MKKLIYICFVSILFTTVLLSCSAADNDENKAERFPNDPESGWVQFDNDNPVNIVYGSASTISLPVTLHAPINRDGLVVTYNITDVNGDSSTILPERTGTFEIAPDGLTGNLVLNIADVNFTHSATFDVNLVSTDKSNVRPGLSDGSKPTVIRVQVCAYHIDATYNGHVVSIPGTGNTRPPFTGPDFTVNLVPVVGTTNQFMIDSVWGIAFFPTYVGQPNNPNARRDFPAIITVNADNTVSIVGNSTVPQNNIWYPSNVNTGTYDPCSNTFDLILNTGVLSGTGTIKAHVTYTPVTN